MLQVWDESSEGFRIWAEDFALKQGMSREYIAGILREIDRKNQAVPGNSVAEKDFITLCCNEIQLRYVLSWVEKS